MGAVDVLIGDWKIIEVAEVDFSNTSDLLFSYEEGFSNGSLWPREYS